MAAKVYLGGLFRRYFKGTLFTLFMNPTIILPPKPQSPNLVFLRDTGTFLFSRVAVSVTTLLNIIVFTRLFSPKDYGNYTMVTAGVALLAIITVCWICNSTLRFFPIYELSNQLDRFYRTVLQLTFTTTAATVFLSLLFLFLYPLINQNTIPKELYSLMVAGLALFILISFSQVLLNILRARRVISWYTFFNSSHNVAGFILGLLLVVGLGMGVNGLIWGSFLGIAATFVWLWKLAINHSIFQSTNTDISLMWKFARYGIPTGMISFQSWILSFADRYLLGLFRGSHEVGIYSASYLLSEQSIFAIISLFSVTSIPIAFNLWEREGKQATKNFMADLARYYLLIGVPAIVGLSALAKPIAKVFVAPEYWEGYRIMPIVALGAFLVGTSNLYAESFTFHKRTDLLMWCYLCSGILNIGLNLWWISRYGYMAAAVATLASHFCLLVLTAWLSRNFFIWNFPFSSLGKVITSAVPMGLAVYKLSTHLTPFPALNLAIAIPAGILIYAATLFFLGEFRPGEKKWLGKLVWREAL
ncbi:MAG: polysaccharide biosynthesis C-terminal domain-containing protein [Elusimicrobia bacterium]|nr:polysaccharide biosynthesis C-terminal domain-containing protein [Elusimicrobiota bacterium]